LLLPYQYSNLLCSHKQVTHFSLFFHCIVFCATSFSQLCDHSVQHICLQQHTSYNFQCNILFTIKSINWNITETEIGNLCKKKSSIFLKYKFSFHFIME
jgi:hypothetical protein